MIRANLYAILGVISFLAAILLQDVLFGIFAIYFAVYSIGYRIEAAIKSRG